MSRSFKGSTWKRSLGLAAALLCAWGTYASAAVDPAYADKYVQVQNQLEQRVTNEERQAAADTLKKWREDVAAAKLLYKKQPATSTSGPLKGIANIDYDTVPVGPGEILRNGQPKPPDYFSTANWAFSPPLPKFVDTLAGVGPDGANNLENYISIAVPDQTSYPGSDYYEIDLVQFSQKMHSNLPPTRLRGYVQANLAADGTATCGGKTGVACPTEYVEPPRYLGATIVAQRNVPVRIKFTNKLPNSENGGDLFIPVDTSVMGAGEGPLTPGGDICDPELAACANYSQNRATIHLHGGRTPWISDGTPHQWITPADEVTPYPQGVSVANVPDMEDPGPGAMTFYYTNQQTARLMFYHDHAFGITRLNVYAGEASGYLVQDEYEQDLVNNGVIPADVFPLVLQDKTFVDASEIRKYDPLWNYGSGPQTGVGADGKPIYAPVEGDLWLPHVYMPAQFPENPDLSGVSPFGRWMYGPWFYPPTVITHGPTANPYFDPDCSSTNPYVLADCQTPGQNSLMPATPHPSMGMEAFADTAVVNGTVFPALEVEPRAYRFRILNAANDRGFNLSFYKADTSFSSPAAVALSPYTEVKMVDAAPTPGWPELWPTDGRPEGVPDPGTLDPSTGRWSNWGPSFIQIGTDAGFLPKPAIRDPQPVTWMTDPTAFWVGIVKDTALGIMPAERADVIVDFCDYAGQTLILYNDAPAAWPAGVGIYDYYTGAPDNRDAGGYGAGGTFNPVTGVYDNGVGILPGYGPNTRTVMQVKVKEGQCAPFDMDALNNEFLTENNTSGATLFERAMEPIIVGQDYYNEVYPNSSFPSAAPWRGVRNALTERTLKFVTIDGDHLEIKLQPKGIHDEMGASFDPEYGRMSGNLSIELDPPTTNNANLNLYGFSDIPTETVANSEGAKIQVDSLGQLADGTQIWNVSHNGVDTHPIHFHIFDVQLISRIGWDGQIALPEPNEYGWKDTVRISPLMDTVVAVRPVAPLLPFGITNSIRPLNPALPIGSGMGFNSVDPATGQIRATGLVTNVMYNFGWEYVWHCHILSHEEMDMMRPIVLQYDALTADAFTLAPPVENGANVELTWSDPSPVDYTMLPDYTNNDPGDFGNPANEVGFNIWSSAAGTGPYTKVGTALANQTAATVPGSSADKFVIEAFNAGGSTYSDPLAVVTLTVSSNVAAAPATFDFTAVIDAPFAQSVTQVSFYNGTILLGTDFTAPFTYSWTGVQQGSYNITALASASDTGLFALSNILSIAVNTLLTADFTVNAGLPIGVCDTGTLTDASTNGTVTAWNWLVNGVTYTTQNVTLPRLPAGTYPVTLKVTGSSGNVAQTTKEVVIVNHPPTADAGGPYLLDFNGTVMLDGSGADLLDPCNTLTYAWDIDTDGTYDYFAADRTLKFSVIQPWIGSGDRTIVLKVTDSSGESTTATATLSVGPAPNADAPATITVPANSSTGSYTITWESAIIVGATYTLEEATDSNFTDATVVASGLTTTSKAITGKTDGLYYYRVQTIAVATVPSTWTAGNNPCAILITAVTSPAAGSTFNPGQTVTVVGSATTPTGYTVASMAFFDNGVLIGTDSDGAPYTVAYNPTSLGAHLLTATTTYVGGAVSPSSDVAIAIAGVEAPVLTISSAIHYLGDTINLDVTPAAVVGVVPTPTVIAVAYYQGITPIGFDDTAPYSLGWVPATSGVKSVTAVALYSNGMSATSAAHSVTVNPPLAITTTALAYGSVNAAYSVQVSANGAFPPFSWSATGLPSGLTIDPSTGVISGTPTNVVATNVAFAIFPITITVTDNAAVTTNKNLDLRIYQAATASPSGLSATATGPNQIDLTWVDNANNEDSFYLLRATDIDFTVGARAWTIAKDQVTFSDTTVVASTTYYYQVRAKNITGFSAYSNIATVTTANTAAVITTSVLTAGSVNIAYNQAVTATAGTPPYSWAATGLPGGLTIDPVTGVISGNPDNLLVVGATSATFPVTITVTDSTTVTANKILNLLVKQVVPAVPSALNASAASTNQVDLTWVDNSNNEESFYLLRATDINFTIGARAWTLAKDQIAFADTTVAAGTTYYYQVRAKNLVGYSVYSNIVTVTTAGPPAVITTSVLSTCNVNVAYSQTVIATAGTPPYSWSATGLPGGLTMDPATGVISGKADNLLVVNATSATFPVTITVTDSTMATANKTLNLLVKQAIPTVPSALNANAVSSNQVDLTWVDNANNETSFYLLRSTDINFTVGARAWTLAKDQVSFVDTTAVAGTTYYYRIRAWNLIGYSAYSDTVSVTTP